MTPTHEFDGIRIFTGDMRAVLAELEPESIDCVVTSPPYWSLRDYGLPPAAWGGDPEHEHAWGAPIPLPNEAVTGTDRWQHATNGEGRSYEIPADFRSKAAATQGQLCECGAWLGQLGLEPDHRLFVEHIVEAMTAVWRVLKPTGTLWLNLGDTYAAKGRGSDEGWATSRLHNAGRIQKAQRASLRSMGQARHRGKAAGLKEKDRAMIPARCAIALQEAGWWLRDEIVWFKRNPMPSSTSDRTTPAHEMVYMLAKRPRYHYDADAIAEPAVTALEAKWDPGTSGHRGGVSHAGSGASTRRFKHPKRPAGWNDGPTENDRVGRYAGRADGRWPEIGGKTADNRLARGRDQQEGMTANLTRNKRSVWDIPTQPYPSAHFATFPERLVEPMILAGCPPDGVVLDPFGGSGTVGQVARRLGRRAVLVDMNPEYVAQALIRASEGLADPGGEYADDGLWAVLA